MDEFENPFVSPREPKPLPTEWVGEYSYDPSFEVEVELLPVSFKCHGCAEITAKSKAP